MIIIIVILVTLSFLGTDYRSVYRGEERKCTVSSLTPGQKYFLRVAACSEEGGQGEVSPLFYIACDFWKTLPCLLF